MYNQQNNPAIITTIQQEEFNGYTFKSPINANDIDSIRNGDIESIVNKNFSLYNYFTYFMNICCVLFNFHKLLDIKNTVFNKVLFDFGKFAICRTQSGELVFRVFTVMDYNEKGEPSKIKAWKYIPMGTEATVEEEPYTYNDFVIFQINSSGTPLKYYVYYFVSKIVDIQRSIDNNVWQHQQPVVVEATDETKLALTNFFEKIQNKVRVIFTKKSAHLSEAINTVNMAGEWTADKGIEVKEEIKREFFTFLGIDHIPYEKKERLITAEASANDMLLELSRGAMLLSLNEAIEEAQRKKIDLGISAVDLSIDVEKLEQVDTDIDEEDEEDETEEGGE